MASSRRARLVLHGKESESEVVRRAVLAARERGAALEVRVTWEGGDAARYAAEAVRDGLDTVIAGGGDGTVNDVLQGLVGAGGAGGAHTSLGILPLGTANDLARSAGIPLDPDEALRLALETEPRAVDVGRSGSRVFLNVATGGFGTKVTVETSPELKRALGGAAYLVTGLASLGELTPIAARLRGPGLAWEGELLVLAVGNGRQAGGGNLLCPAALLDDGLLDVRVLAQVRGQTWQTALEALVTKGLPEDDETVPSFRVPWVEVETGDTLYVNLDGEPVAGTRHRFEVEPRRIGLHVPAACPLLRGG